MRINQTAKAYRHEKLIGRVSDLFSLKDRAIFKQMIVRFIST
ncbi:hypothetical protein CEV34_1260 [Brucella pseudogrignonensis]|uniref:Uncharacterized protein n=1 Tax=Brucella pseudogrignonensis TaxID=419475 RepID=A0A256GM13_9HYPH|nr:hypothetical protein CEV34_1260 [Brucella pseudogrignonensis]